VTHRAGQSRAPVACAAAAGACRDRADEPVIVSAALAGGHDGLPDLVLHIRYENGALGNVTIDNGAGFRLMKRCGAHQIEQLAGQSWREIRNALLEE
jgi:hypothetical protein